MKSEKSPSGSHKRYTRRIPFDREASFFVVCLRNSNLYTSDGFRLSDLLIRDGVVAAIAPADGAEGDVASGLTPDLTLDMKGAAVIPGLWDLHVHFREPGYSYKETIRGGVEAAVAGGFTGVCTMPNLNPVPDSREHLEAQLDLIRKADPLLKVLPYGSITCKRMGEKLTDFAALRDDVAGFSDDGTGVQDEETMRAAMKQAKSTDSLIAAHCEVDSLLRGGYIHDGEYAREHGHRGICSESEWREIERDIKLAEEESARLHICHVSTKEGVALVREAKRRGVKVTAETGPHYLWYCDEDLREEGRYKMNPPLRSRRDMEALREGVACGAVDVIATDHAPHSAEEKSRGLEKSAMGVVGLETSFGAVYTKMCRELGMPFGRLVDAMAVRPRRILGLKGFESGGVAEGDPAELTIANLEEQYRVDPSKFAGSGRATPFEGERLTGAVVGIITPRGISLREDMTIKE